MIKNKKNLFAFSVILAIFFLSMVNGSISVAAYTPSSAGSSSTMEGDGLVFDIQKGYPIPTNGYPTQYGVIIPDTNMWTSYVVHASNQGEFDIIQWDGTSDQDLTIDNPGDDISFISPWYFEDYYLDSRTNNDYINPWSDIRWLQANASIAENDTLMPYTVNSVWNYYVMTEGSSLTVPVKDPNPIQVDIIVGKTGPKVLKCSLDGSVDDIDNLRIVSPSGKWIEEEDYEAEFDSDHLFWYYIFVAHEVGTYRLLLQEDTTPDDLHIEFLEFDLKTLPINTLTYGGTTDETPSGKNYYENEWKTEWWKFYGNKGDKFKLEIEEDFSYGDDTDFDLWVPTCDGYDRRSGGPMNVIRGLPTTGYYYISVVHNEALSLYRYSLFLKQISVSDYHIEDDLTIEISKDEFKAIEFEVPQDSFVRFNFTLDSSLPTGSETDPWNFMLHDAKKFRCYEFIYDINMTTVSGEDFYYYYMPAGTYETFIYNLDDTKDGIFQMSSKYINWTDDYIPVNTLTYPDIYPSLFESVEFEPDEDYPSLKQAKVLNFEITDPGQYFLNTTILGSKNLAAIPATGSPSYFYVYNFTDTTYYDSGYPIPAFSTDGAQDTGDYFYIGSQQKYTGLLFNFTTPGVGGNIDLQVYGGFWDDFDLLTMGTSSDGTNDLTQNGTMEFDPTQAYWDNWLKGAGGRDFPGIENEDEYYWLRLDCDGPYSTLPIIELITLLNVTISGDINLVLLRDSGYEHCDVWWPDDMVQPVQITDFIISQDEDLMPYDSDASAIIESGDPWTIGFEEGTYKLLIIPEHWDYAGKINIDFAIVDYWGYSKKETYIIDSQPLAYPMNITDGPKIPGLHLYNYSTYPFSVTYIFENSKVEILDDEGYFVLDCYGSAYNWTQLVFRSDQISTGNTIGDGGGGDGVDIYLMQDLPWVGDDGPNDEVILLADSLIQNTTIEFGVFSDHFYLIFEYVNRPAAGDWMFFYIDLNQYNTGRLTTSALMAVAIPAPGDGDGDGDRDLWEEEIPGWVPIGVIAVIGAGIVAIVIYAKKKGIILSKTP